MMKIASTLFTLFGLTTVFSQCNLSPPSSGNYIMDLRQVTDKKNSLQVFLTDGTKESCVEMKTNRRRNIFELECCNVCYQLTEWASGFEDQYVINLAIASINEGELNGMEVRGDYVDSDSGTTLSFTYFLNNVFANPGLFYYFSVPFAEGTGRDEETEVIYILTTQSSVDNSINRIITLRYGGGLGSALTSMDVHDFDASLPGSFGYEVFRDWDYSNNARNLKYFPDFGFGIPVQDNTFTNSCLKSAVVAFEVDSSTKVMTSLDLLDYDMNVAPANGRHNARGIKFTPFGTYVRVFFPYQAPMEFYYEGHRVHQLQESEFRCDRHNVALEDQC